MKNFDYDALTDSLFISRKTSKDKVNGSAEIGNIILDFDSSGKIINVEFKKISNFLETIKIDTNILENLIDASLIVQKQRGAISIFALLKTPLLEQPVPLVTIPMADVLPSA